MKAENANIRLVACRIPITLYKEVEEDMKRFNLNIREALETRLQMFNLCTAFGCVKKPPLATWLACKALPNVRICVRFRQSSAERIKELAEDYKLTTTDMLIYILMVCVLETKEIEYKEDAIRQRPDYNVMLEETLKIIKDTDFSESGEAFTLDGIEIKTNEPEPEQEQNKLRTDVSEYDYSYEDLF